MVMALEMGMEMGKGSEAVARNGEWDPRVRFILSRWLSYYLSSVALLEGSYVVCRHRPARLLQALHLGFEVYVPLVATSKCTRSNLRSH